MSRPPGRPPVYDVAASDRVVVRVTPAQRRDLQRIAAAYGTGFSGVIREWIDDAIERGDADLDADRRPVPTPHPVRHVLDDTDDDE